MNAGNAEVDPWRDGEAQTPSPNPFPVNGEGEPEGSFTRGGFSYEGVQGDNMLGDLRSCLERAARLPPLQKGIAPEDWGECGGPP